MACGVALNKRGQTCQYYTTHVYKYIARSWLGRETRCTQCHMGQVRSRIVRYCSWAGREEVYKGKVAEETCCMHRGYGGSDKGNTMDATLIDACIYWTPVIDNGPACSACLGSRRLLTVYVSSDQTKINVFCLSIFFFCISLQRLVLWLRGLASQACKRLSKEKQKRAL